MQINIDVLRNHIKNLGAPSVAVVGDLILDEYLIGTATRMSREAPIPVLEFERREYIAGGAANPAMNLIALGARVHQFGVVGTDDAGAQLIGMLTAHGIACAGIWQDATRPTTLKMRVMASMGLRFPQQVARIDTVSREPLPAHAQAQVSAALADGARHIHLILASDYRNGLLTPALIGTLRELGTTAGALLTADTQGNLALYRGFGLLKCNAQEATEFLGKPLETDADFAAAARDLCAQLELTRGMVITRGAAGATFAQPNGTTGLCPAPKVTDVFDTVGAGDTAIAVMSIAVLAGAPLADAVMLANVASGLVVRKVGNYAPTRAELFSALDELSEQL